MRAWERVFRRAELPIAYSQGFTPHPRLSLAAPLPLGLTSEAEMMELYLTRRLSTQSFLGMVKPQLPEGLEISEIWIIGEQVPSLQSQVSFAGYRLGIAAGISLEEMKQRTRHLLDLESLPWQHERDTGVRRYDLRPLVKELTVGGEENNLCLLDMLLRCDLSGSGRPEQVALALGLTAQPEFIHRTSLVLGNN